jgi:hypothetical protein
MRAGGLTRDPCAGEILRTLDPELPPGTPWEGPGALHLPLLETGEGLAHRRALGGTLLDWTTRSFGSGGEAVTGLRNARSARDASVGPSTTPMRGHPASFSVRGALVPTLWSA